MRVAIIGAGATGSSAARWCAEAGHEVHLFERFGFGHARGSSHGSSRIFRSTYADPLYAAIMRDALDLWRKLERDAGETLLHATGLLSFGPHDSRWLAAAAASLASLGVPHEEIDAKEARRRFPGLAVPADARAILEPGAGWLRADRILAANLRLARRAGVVLHEHAEARVGPDGSVAGMRFDAIAVCAGPWIREHVALPVEVTLQHFAYFAAPRGRDVPVWIEAGADFDYGFPDAGGGCKIGRHRLGAPVEPAHVHSPDPGIVAALGATARRLLGSDGRAVQAGTCLYTNAPREDFVIGSLPCAVPAWFVSACSGHAFKFTSWLGRLVRDLVAGRATPSDYPRFDPARGRE